MAEKTEVILQEINNSIEIIKWKVKELSTLSLGQLILIYKSSESSEEKKLKATKAGILKRLLVKQGARVHYGEGLYEMTVCSHPTVMKDMCAECGTDLRKQEIVSLASVPMLHSIPELKVTQQLAEKIGKADTDRLLADRKLVLLVDLDQTLIHTTNDYVASNIKDIYRFQLYGPRSIWYFTRLRPGTERFLANMSKLYELHICTFGARNYAHTIAMFLDPEKKYFSHRILSRDECFNPTSKTANLKALFPCGDNMVCIIDDREDVWSNASNLIHVKPYHFFQHTGDINAPPGLQKQEFDDETYCLDIKVSTNNSDIITNQTNDEKLNTTDQNNDKIENNENFSQIIVENDLSKTNKCEKRESKFDSRDKISLNGDILKNNDDKNVGILINLKNDKSNDKIENKINEEQKKEIIQNDVCEILNEKYQTKAVEKQIKINKHDESIKESDINKNEETSKNEKINTDILKNEEVNENEEENVKTNEMNELNEEEHKPSTELKNEETIKTRFTNEWRELNDNDNYLKSLEQILEKIHKEFYEIYNKTGTVPDLKQVVPHVRGEVLKNKKLVFSGLVPTHVKLEDSKAYKVARNLGAQVTQDLQKDTTHLIVVKPGTAKYNTARRRKNIHIVTPEWLWTCAECWDVMDETKFPVRFNLIQKSRNPPAHCSSPEHLHFSDTDDILNDKIGGHSRKRTDSGRFMDTINPLMSFSSADLADMQCEVQDIFNESDDDDDDTEVKQEEDIEADDDESEMEKGIETRLDREEDDDEESKQNQTDAIILRELKKMSDSDKTSSSSSSEESLTAEHPKGWGRKNSPPRGRGGVRRKRPYEILGGETTTEGYGEGESTQESEPFSVKFRRGEKLSSDLDLAVSDESFEEAGDLDEGGEDDGDWNMIGAAIEREFLAENN